MTSPSSTPLVKVKPLVWSPEEDGHSIGRLGERSIASTERNIPPSYRVSLTVDCFAPYRPSRVVPPAHPTLEAAQAAAQLEWDRFVRSAIEP